MKALTASALLVVLLTGCEELPPKPQVPTYAERQATFEHSLASWDGADVNQLIAQFGSPTSTYTMPNGNVLYTYTSGGYFASVPIFCTKNFVVSSSTGRIVGHSYNGKCVF